MSTGSAPMFFSSVAQSPPAEDSVYVKTRPPQKLIYFTHNADPPTFDILHHHAEVPPGLEGTEHRHHKGVLCKCQDVALHEGLLDLVPQDKVLLVDLLHGETLSGLFVPHQEHSAKQQT